MLNKKYDNEGNKQVYYIPGQGMATEKYLIFPMMGQ
jgi:hypothetical protein